jgi:hypothetical protein
VANHHQRSRHFAKIPNSKLIKTRQIMQTNILDLSILPLPLQQELIDFYQFLCEKQAKAKTLTLDNSQLNHTTGFAMLKSNRAAVPTDFDPASLLSHDRT